MDIVSFNEAATANARIENFIKDPDSNSGIITVPKVIGSGESVTIPAGRVAVLPNIQVDGTLNVESGGEIFIPAGATLNKVVELEGDQTIDDVKTFLKSPIVPTPSSGDNSTKIATTAFVKAKSEADSIGIGQTWQDITASRALGTLYTNISGKPEYFRLKVGNNAGVNNILTITIAGVSTTVIGNGSYQPNMVEYFIVKNGDSYSASTSAGTYQSWHKLG